MLDKIKASIFQKYKKDEVKWIFFSVFNDKWNLLISNWVFYTDKSLDELIDTLYRWLIEKHTDIWNIVVDIIWETSEIKSSEEIQNISLKDFGILLSSENKSGILLPDTKWVNNIQEWLKIIKEKNNLSSNVQITKFKTDRFCI